MFKYRIEDEISRPLSWDKCFLTRDGGWYEGKVKTHETSHPTQGVVAGYDVKAKLSRKLWGSVNG